MLARIAQWVIARMDMNGRQVSEVSEAGFAGSRLAALDVLVSETGTVPHGVNLMLLFGDDTPPLHGA